MKVRRRKVKVAQHQANRTGKKARERARKEAFRKARKASKKPA